MVEFISIASPPRLVLFRPVTVYKWISDTTRVYKTNEMLVPVEERQLSLVKGDREALPEHDQDVRDMIHLVVVYKLELFVRSGHEEGAAAEIKEMYRDDWRG